MKPSFRTLSVLVLLVAAPLALSAIQAPGGSGQGQPPVGQGPGGKGQGDKGPGETGGGRGPGGPRDVVGLEGGMKGLNFGLKRMKGALEQKDYAGIAAIAVEMQRAAGAAKTETPPSAEAITDPAQKAEFVKGFRMMLIDLQRNLLDLEVAALDGKGDEVQKIVETKLKPGRDAGHAKYDPEDAK